MNDKYTKKKCRNTPIQQKNDSPDLPFYFTLSFFYCFRNANSLPGKRSTAGCFCLIKPKKSRIFGIFPKRKHCTIVSFVQCSYEIISKEIFDAVQSERQRRSNVVIDENGEKKRAGKRYCSKITPETDIESFDDTLDYSSYSE